MKRTVFDPLMRFKLKKVIEMMSHTHEAIKTATEPEELDLLLREKVALDKIKSELAAFFDTTIL